MTTTTTTVRDLLISAGWPADEADSRGVRRRTVGYGLVSRDKAKIDVRTLLPAGAVVVTEEGRAPLSYAGRPDCPYISIGGQPAEAPCAVLAMLLDADASVEVTL